MSEHLQQLDEVFDEEKAALPVTNLYPATKIPQIFAIKAPSDSVVLRMCSYTGGGDSNKNIKPGDKMIHAIMLGLSAKGGLVKLKNLTDDPIGVISTAFDIVASTAKQYKIDACMFRIAKNKLGGKARQVQIILERLVRSRLGGRYVILKELYDYDSKYAYILIHRKGIDLTTVQGIPEISTELFIKTETKVGDVYVSKETGKPVTKDEAVAATIAQENDSRSDQAVIARTKISRRETIMAQYGNKASYDTSDWTPEVSKIRDNLNAAPPVYLATESPNEDVAIITKSSVEEIRDHIDDALTDIEMYYDGDEEDRRNTSYKFKRFVEDLKTKTKNFNKSIALMTPRTEAEIDKMTKKAAIEYYDIIKEFNGKNHLEIFKKLAGIIVNTYAEGEVMPDQRQEFVTDLISRFNSDINSSIVKQYGLLADKLSPKGLTTDEVNAIMRYCGTAYSEINDFLIGGDTSVKTVREKIIPNLDSAFQKGGVTLPKGTPVYRGMSIPYNDLAPALERKLFYFTNFVSTSLVPAFVGMYGSSVDVLDRDGSKEIDFDNGDEFNKDEIASYQIKPRVGLAINGADKIKVIVPGGLTDFKEECEVILPRGTVIKFNRAWLSKKGINSKSALIEATIVSPESITESTEVYDGDALINEGVVKRLSFSKFLKENEEPVDDDSVYVSDETEAVKRSVIQENTPEMDLILDLLVPMKEKFEIS